MTDAQASNLPTLALAPRKATDSLLPRKIRLTPDEKVGLERLADEKAMSIQEIIESSISELLLRLENDEPAIVLMPPSDAPRTSIKVRQSVIDNIKHFLDSGPHNAFSISDLIAASICANLTRNKSTQRFVNQRRTALQIVRTAA